ncbi:MAG: sigma factor, partial [Candidatus Burarchaeum sp.]|nr:sigma factor [Candidatus Burarchaeum sp.]
MPLVSEKYGPVVSWKYLPLGKITGRARDIINEELFAEYTKPDTPEKFKREIEAELVSLNGTLVDQIANKYSRGLSWIKMERDDLVSEGGDGLLTAIRKFEPWIEVPFAKFAPWWIRQRISRAIKDQRELIHCPEEVQLKVHKMKKIEDGMTEELTEPTTEAIARKMGIEEKKVVCLRAAKKMMRTDSLDVPIGDESEGATISALIPTQEKNPEE